MGAGAFRGTVGTDEGLGERDAHGLEGDAEGREDISSVQEDGPAEDFEVCLALFSGGRG